MQLLTRKLAVPIDSRYFYFLVKYLYVFLSEQIKLLLRYLYPNKENYEKHMKLNSTHILAALFRHQRIHVLFMPQNVNKANVQSIQLIF